MSKIDSLIAKRAEIKASIQRSLAQLETARAELDAVDDELFSVLQRVLHAVEDISAPADVVQAIQDSEKLHPENANRVSQSPNTRGELESKITEVLTDAPGPMRPAQILFELRRRGYQVSGKRPANNIAAHLSYGKEKFVRTENGWMLRGPSLWKQETTKENAPVGAFSCN